MGFVAIAIWQKKGAKEDMSNKILLYIFFWKHVFVLLAFKIQCANGREKLITMIMNKPTIKNLETDSHKLPKLLIMRSLCS